MTEPGTEIAHREDRTMLVPHTDSWVEVARPVFQLAAQIADTDFVPKAWQGNPAAIAAAILRGRELGMAPLTALALQDPIEGRTSMSAKGLRALVLAQGHEIEVLESTGAVCTMRGRRKGSENWTKISWTLDMARAANLANKFNWKNYPRRMLQARASSELCDLVFPDITNGIAATEELEDLRDGEGPPAETTTKVSRAPKKAAEPPPAPVERQRAELPPRAPVEPPKASEGDGSPDDMDATAAPAEPPERNAPPVSAAQLRMLGAQWNRLEVTDDERRTYTSLIVGRPMESTKEMNVAEATGLIDKIKDLTDRAALEAMLESLAEAHQPELVTG